MTRIEGVVDEERTAPEELTSKEDDRGDEREVEEEEEESELEKERCNRHRSSTTVGVSTTAKGRRRSRGGWRELQGRSGGDERRPAPP